VNSRHGGSGDTVGTWMVGGFIVSAIFVGWDSALWFAGMLVAGFIVIPLFYTLVASRTYRDWPLRLGMMVIFSLAVLGLLLWIFNPK
jgi:hypothetical protein